MNAGDFSQAIENCVIASAWKKSDSQILDTPEVFKLTNVQNPFEFMNGVYRSQFAVDRIDQIIERHVQGFKNHGINFRWYVFPHSKPLNLDERLQKFNPSAVTEMQGLFARTNDPQFKMPAGVTVEELSAENIEEYIQTSNSGWGQSGAYAEKIKKSMRDDLASGQTDYRGFLARFDGKPAATGLLRIVNGFGYFYGGSTRPEFRGKGAYRGLLCYRLRLLESEGIEVALVLARKATSAPICLKLGFQVACECRSYDFLGS